jgi:hypothetical protein
MAPTRRRLALVVGGAAALLATACGSSLGYKTPCSVWVSMDVADQQSTMITIAQQEGDPNPSAGISDAVRLANAYCADPLAGDDTIGGMLDSRPP